MGARLGLRELDEMEHRPRRALVARLGQGEMVEMGLESESWMRRPRQAMGAHLGHLVSVRGGK